MDALVELLFKYRPFAFAKGVLGFASPVPVWILILGALLVVGMSVWIYASRHSSVRTRDRIALITLRAVGVAAVTFSLARPVLVLTETIAQRNVVGIVVDDSRSMRVRDADGATRGDLIASIAGGPDSALLRALSDKYQIRVFRLSGGGRLADASSVQYNATRTRLATSLLRIEDDLTGAPTAGLILMSDGADNSSGTTGETSLNEQLLALRARRVPIYTIGIGRERFAKDIEVSRVETPRSVLRDASLLVDVVLMQRGFGGARVPVVVEDSGRIVGSTVVTLPRDGEAVSVRVRIPATEKGARLLRVHVPTQAGEEVAENNERRTLVVVRDRREKIFYMEGEPRPELAFLRRAVENDGNVQVVTLLRSAKEKFLRLGVDDSLELATGFPKTREELFSYRAIILGSIEAAFFTADQLRMLADFVSERGGGLLVIGGRNSLGEGGYGGTAVSDALPLELSGAIGDPPSLAEVQATPTTMGALHPALQVASTDSASTARWKTLPMLTSVNRLGRAKPGATILLDGTPSDGGAPRPLLAWQRYGRGKAIVLSAQDSWLWQMDAPIAGTDMTHETFWRQMLRWLVSEVPDRVEVTLPDESGPGEGIPLRASVSDSAFLKSNGATVEASVISPGGSSSEVTLEWAVDRDGEYRGTYVPDSMGVHEVRMLAGMGKDTLVGEPVYVRVAEPTAEYFGSEMRSTLLRQISDETGGRYYPADRALDVTKDIAYGASGATVVKKQDLWDMPIIFLVLLLALGGEWFLRRRRGLA